MVMHQGQSSIDRGPRSLPRPTRRRMLAGAVTAWTAAAVAGCDLLGTEPSSTSGQKGTGDSRTQKEAPSLARQVKAGKLPPLEKRLPRNPLVVTPFEHAGIYGGTIHNALLGSANSTYVYQFTGYDQLLRAKPDWTGKAGTSDLEVDIAEKYDVNADGTVFTFHLRQGIKWSDGKPFTADDVVFAMEDVLLNTTLSPVPPTWLVTTNGKPGRAKKLDDHTLTITFTEPAGLFLKQLATPSAPALTTSPRHYLRQFHKKYNPDIGELVKKEGVRDWAELFASKTYSWGEQNPDLPTLGPWMLKTPLGKGTRVVLTRNPYYWKTDPSGTQLPYLDEVVYDVLNNAQVMLLKAIHGDLNVEAGPNTRITTSQNKPILARNRKKSGYRFINARNVHMNLICIYLNQTSKDKVKRQLFRDKNLRIGLSYAINRKEVIDTTMQRQGTPYQAAPLPESPFYDAEFAHQYLDYDVDKANVYLDKVAPKKNGQGIRLGPDGQPINFRMEFANSLHPEWPDALELVRKYWHAVGVEMGVKSETGSLVREHASANQFDATVWHGDGGLAPILYPVNYFPHETGGGWFGVDWALWYTSRGSDGERPPAAPRRQMQLYDQLRTTLDAKEQDRLMRELLRIVKEQFYVIGIAMVKDNYFIAANDLRNLPEPMTQAWIYPTPGPSRTEQWYDRTGGDAS